MSFDSLLINHMKVAQTTYDTWSEPTEVVGAAIPCRIMYHNRLMRDYKGEEVLSGAKIFVKPEHITHPIIIIKQPQNSVHIHHAEVWVQ